MFLYVLAISNKSVGEWRFLSHNTKMDIGLAAFATSLFVTRTFISTAASRQISVLKMFLLFVSLHTIIWHRHFWYLGWYGDDVYIYHATRRDITTRSSAHHSLPRSTIPKKRSRQSLGLLPIEDWWYYYISYMPCDERILHYDIASLSFQRGTIAINRKILRHLSLLNKDMPSAAESTTSQGVVAHFMHEI